MASSAKSGMVDSICLAKQADLEAVAFSGTGRRLARAAIGLRLMFRVLGCGNGGFELSWAAVESLVKKWGKGREWIHGWRFRA